MKSKKMIYPISSLKSLLRIDSRKDFSNQSNQSRNQNERTYAQPKDIFGISVASSHSSLRIGRRAAMRMDELLLRQQIIRKHQEQSFDQSEYLAISEELDTIYQELDLDDLVGEDIDSKWGDLDTTVGDDLDDLEELDVDYDDYMKLFS